MTIFKNDSEFELLKNVKAFITYPESLSPRIMVALRQKATSQIVIRQHHPINSKPPEIFLQESASVVDCCYRDGQLLLLDSNLLVKVFNEKNANPIMKINIEHLQGLHQRVREGLRLHEFRFSSGSVTTSNSLYSLETGKKFGYQLDRNELNGKMLESGSSLLVFLSYKGYQLTVSDDLGSR